MRPLGIGEWQFVVGRISITLLVIRGEFVLCSREFCGDGGNDGVSLIIVYLSLSITVAVGKSRSLGLRGFAVNYERLFLFLHSLGTT